MKNKILNSTFAIILCIVFGNAFTACSDWTDPDSIDVTIPNSEDIDPVVYAKYLEAIRAYKLQDHELVYTWFDNSSKQPQSRADHLISLPDSIDLISLMHPNNLASWELDEIATVKSDKGMKVVFDIDYAVIEAIYVDSVGKLAEFIATDFVTAVLKPQVNQYLSYIDKYNYDGIILSYAGKAKMHMTSVELSNDTIVQKALFSMIYDWKVANPKKLLIYEGKPENLLDKSILQSCENIIIDATSLTSTGSIALQIMQSQVADVPTDKFIVKVSTTSTDASDLKTGYFDESLKAVPTTAAWLSLTNPNFSTVGIGIYNVQNDYFNSTMTYSNTRYAINTLNPSF